MPIFNKLKIDQLYFRKKLINKMAAIYDFPLTVLEAPMGYGKTTILREQIKTHQGIVLWQTIADDSTQSFWLNFSHLFSKLSLECSENLLGLGFPETSLAMKNAIDWISQVKFTAETILIIDDYHLLKSKVADRFIELLVKENIPQLHLLLASRSPFGNNTAELSLKRFCNHV